MYHFWVLNDFILFYESLHLKTCDTLLFLDMKQPGLEVQACQSVPRHPLAMSFNIIH